MKPLDQIPGLEDVTERDYWPTQSSDLLKPPADLATAIHFHTVRDTEAGRVEGYRLASEVLVRYMLDHPGERDVLVYPFAQNWRHHLELRLKWILRLLHDFHDEPPPSSRTHQLERLWQDVKSRLDPFMYAIEADDLGYADRLLVQLAQMDPDGQNFRYHRRTDGTFSLDGVRPLDLRELHDGLSAAANFLSALLDGIYEGLSYKQDMAAESGP